MSASKARGFGQGNKCARCTKTVYHAEETRAIQKIWHTPCFVCANTSCKKRLDSTNVTEHGGEAYCKTCYANLFGPKGYGYAGGAAGSMTLSNHSVSSLSNGSPSTSRSNNISAAFSVALNKDRGSPIPSTKRNKFQSPTSSTPVTVMKDTCGRCNKKVYAAERVWGPGKDQPWHQNCLTCKGCGKRLDSSTMKSHQNEIYCTACFNKHHTPLAKR